MCCKATLLPPDAYGPKAPEGSEEFRFRTIAIKPAFILSQLKATRLPVVWLDTDLEFHSFPRLFMPGRLGLGKGLGLGLGLWPAWSNPSS